MIALLLLLLLLLLPPPVVMGEPVSVRCVFTYDGAVNFVLVLLQ